MEVIKPKFDDHRLSELYDLLDSVIRDYCSKNNLHYPSAIGVMEFIKHDLINYED